MPTITLQRIKNPSSDPYIKCLMADYEVPKPCHVFAGAGLNDYERVVFFIGQDGGGFGAVSYDPGAYVKLSARMERCRQAAIAVQPGIADGEEYNSQAQAASDAERGKSFDPDDYNCCPDEFVFDPGSFDYDAEELEEDAVLSFL